MNDKMTKPKLLIATPAYGGVVTTRYMHGIYQTLMGLEHDGLVSGMQVYTLDSESLISRARDRCAMYALEHGFDKLLFIYSDMRWTYEMVRRLLLSGREIIGGTYPLKGFPITLNFNPLLIHAEDFNRNRQYDDYVRFIEKHADASGLVEVRHVPTGFLMIDCHVLNELAKHRLVEQYSSFDTISRTVKDFFSFFPVRVKDLILESEDWAFCSIARDAGFKVWLDTQCVTDHTGSHTYAIGQHEIICGQRPLLPSGGRK